MAQAKFCFNCGVALAEGEKFCHQCGKQLDGVAPTPANAPPVPANAPPATSHNDTLNQIGSLVGSIIGAGIRAVQSAPPVSYGVQRPGAGGMFKCIHCQGTGRCRFCHGVGFHGRMSCIHCNGSGYCSFCGGRGWH